MIRWYCFAALFLGQICAYAQTTDTLKQLATVKIQAYITEQSLFKTPSAVSVIDQNLLNKQPGNSLIPALNTIPGVKMEERSPGSYRLSIRGSLLRSPFGIRNVKVYLDEFPLTDAGGNTYLNLIDVQSISELEILKGPDGSLFGANSGGVVLLKSFAKTNDSLSAAAELQTGSYGLFRESAQFLKAAEKYSIKLNQSFQQSNGYRDNSSMDRKYVQASQKWKYSTKNEFRSVIFYSDLNYKTPGGLTFDQYQTNPQAARPATATLPGAEEQNAGIYNTTLFAGLLHQAEISKTLKHIVAFSASHTDFENPFISNYEIRKENNLGLRTFLEYKPALSGTINYQIQTGLETQQNDSDISNFGNKKGTKDTLQSSDKLKAYQAFYFARLSGDIAGKLFFEAALSLNQFKYKFAPINSPLQTKNFNAELMPRLAFSYLLNDQLVLRTSLSKGFSSPTISEIRSSNQEINTGLEAEKGWNLETGIRLRSLDDRFWLDLSAYQYKLKNAIVRRVDQSDADFFVNAGGTNQIGLESQANAWILTYNQTRFIRSLQFSNSLSLNHYRFDNYQIASKNYSGNNLTGVPGFIATSFLSSVLPLNSYFYIQHSYNGKTPLNDSNSLFASAYNLIQIKAGT
ncbi:MAG: TonB-dependent receptor, partial [Daejeonella sp.]